MHRLNPVLDASLTLLGQLIVRFFFLTTPIRHCPSPKLKEFFVCTIVNAIAVGQLATSRGNAEKQKKNRFDTYMYVNFNFNFNLRKHNKLLS
jgi:hypothetical protein